MRNDWYIKAGKDFLAFSLLVIGSIHILTGNFPTGLLPIPDTVPGRGIFVYISGSALIVAAVLLMLRRYAGAYIGGIVFLLILVCFQIPTLIKDIYDANTWTSTFEILALFSGMLLLAGIFLPSELHRKWQIGSSAGLLTAGRFLFATTLIVFGVQHYIYKQFIIGLIPSWIPVKDLMQELVMVAFFAVAISIFLQQLERIATALLAFMFFLWFWMLHIPRVIEHPRVETEWTSLFIVMAMCGISLLTMGTARYGRE